MVLGLASYVRPHWLHFIHMHSKVSGVLEQMELYRFVLEIQPSHFGVIPRSPPRTDLILPCHRGRCLAYLTNKIGHPSTALFGFSCGDKLLFAG
jgi:hypothetical protein